MLVIDLTTFGTLISNWQQGAAMSFIGIVNLSS
jgi:hypothetical protein